MNLATLNFNLENARECADYARRAYDEPPTLSAKDTDTQVLIKPLSLLNSSPLSPIIVAFRGTTNVADFITDMRAWRTPVVCGEVHAGFWTAWQSIRDDLLNFLLIYVNRPIIITGHSLGGALAIICAKYLAVRGFNVQGVYTFGAPRVGDKTFCINYDSFYGSALLAPLQRITFNVTCQDDPVPLIPPLLNGYRDCGTEQFIIAGEIIRNPFYGFELLVDLLGALNSWRQHRLALLPNHHINHYIEALEAIRGEDCPTDSPASYQEAT